ncbi:myelin protein zero-like protein 2 [Podarcis muralis]|uniref:Zero 2 n=1 Tax=Podarcis lilfordi TaxID=74358 RepID=A0AA35LGQ2_9SAUR|nr:zero 2 [Podarcis lilfordi]
MAPRSQGLPGPSWVGFLLLVLWPVSAVDIYTPKSLEVLNGTEVRLKCTFRSYSAVGSKLTVSWHFQPEEPGRSEFVFYYSEEPFPPTSGRFKGRVTWDGNIHKNDGSIILWDTKPSDNGTFQCHVRNPPDVDGPTGEIQLRVVTKVTFSEIHILAFIIGAVCFLMIVIVVVVVICRYRKRRHGDTESEVEETELPEKENLKETEKHLLEEGA